MQPQPLWAGGCVLDLRRWRIGRGPSWLKPCLYRAVAGEESAEAFPG